MSSRKGSRTERELMQKFHEAGYGVVRSAGSGVSRYPSPDIIVGNDGRILAIECKASKGSVVYIEPKQIDELLEFSKKFGAKPFIGIRFNYEEWQFLDPSQLEKTIGEKYKVTRELAGKKSIGFSEIV
ncbi:Holliday junction resolvase Hjc [Candidatus Undinarchaeota archaeon]